MGVLPGERGVIHLFEGKIGIWFAGLEGESVLCVRRLMGESFIKFGLCEEIVI